jgi:hypothetical protein
MNKLEIPSIPNENIKLKFSFHTKKPKNWILLSNLLKLKYSNKHKKTDKTDKNNKIFL